MEQWSKRSIEVAYLLNPAFCASLVYLAIKEYSKKISHGLPFSLIYLILPILLHKTTRDDINSKTNMVKWLQNRPELLIGFSKRVNSLLDYTNETIEFLLSHEIVKIVGDKFQIINNLSPTLINVNAEKNREMKDCYLKAEHLGRWFANMKSQENIYIAWGIKP